MTATAMRAPALETQITYLAPGSLINRRFNAIYASEVAEAVRGVPNTMFVVDKIPAREDMQRPMADEDKAIAAAIFHYQPHHRWWYFSNMTRESIELRSVAYFC